MSDVLKVVGAAVLTAGTLAGLGYGSYELYWHVAKANVAHQYDVNTGTQQFQSGLIAQERNLTIAWHKATDPAQKSAIADQFCAVFQNVQPAPADLVVANTSICNGALS